MKSPCDGKIYGLINDCHSSDATIHKDPKPYVIFWMEPSRFTFSIKTNFSKNTCPVIGAKTSCSISCLWLSDIEIEESSAISSFPFIKLPCLMKRIVCMGILNNKLEWKKFLIFLKFFSSVKIFLSKQWSLPLFRNFFLIDY